MIARLFAASAVLLYSLLAVASHPATEWARKEFSSYSAKIFGAAPKVEFMLPGETSDYAADFAALKGTDGYAVRRKGDTVVFIADCPKGHVNGVHRWLERNSDIVWPRPMGDMCFFTPSRKSIDQLDCDYIDIPAFVIRYFGGGASDDETRRYLARNSVSPTMGVSNLKDDDPAVVGAKSYGTIGAFCDVFGGGHDMETRWFPRDEFFKDHPEYWMLIDGERWTGQHSNFCETNPQFVKAYGKSVLSKIANLPKSVKIISINMEDTRKTCTCVNCLKPIRLPGGSVIDKDDPAFLSTRFFIFFNEVARAVAKVRPDLKILQFAYFHLTVPPKVPVERNVILKFCPYPRNMRESVMEGVSNVQWRDRIEGWLANTPEMYWREYYFCQCITYPRPIADTAAVDLRAISKRGVRYVYTDSPGKNGDGDTIITMYSHNRPAREFYDMCAMEAWTIQKLFWNPSLDPEKLRTEFLKRTFGPASLHLAEFFKILRDSWNSETHRSNFNDKSARNAALYIVGKGLKKKCRTALASAEAVADMPERREWIAKMRKILDMWIAEAPNYMDCEINVPEISGVKIPALDIDAKPWTKSTRLPMFKLMRSGSLTDASGSRTAIYSDGDSFQIVFNIKKSGPFAVLRASDNSGYPVCDKAMVAFSHKGRYWHFVFGPTGVKYAGEGLDKRFDGEWSVKTEKSVDGWNAVARIPFASIGFEPIADPSIRFMAMISYSHDDASSQIVNYSLCGAMPFTPQSWTPLRLGMASGGLPVEKRCPAKAQSSVKVVGSKASEIAGWENRNPERRMPEPTAELWHAPVENGLKAFHVDWRDGAKGRVSVSDGAIRIEKHNAVGKVVVTAPHFSAKPGQIVQGYAACYLDGGVVPENAKGYIRLWSGKENLNWVRKYFGSTASDSPLFLHLVNTPKGEFTRKICRTEAGKSGMVTAAIVVEGAPSVTTWRGWGVEDAAIADKAWKKRTSDDREPPDRSGTMIDEKAFDDALAKDVEHSASIVKTAMGGMLQVDGKTVPPILYKPIPFGMGVPFTGEGRIFEKSGIDLQTVNIRFGVGHGRIGFWSKDGFDCAGAVKRVKDFMRTAPNSMFFVTIRCDAYPEYADEHPDEKWLRPDGTVVYGSCSQGQKTASATPKKNTWPWISNHSLVWRRDVKRLMSEFIAELKRTGLAKRIVGIHLAGYHDGQFAVPVADFSKPAQKAFARWQRELYGKVRWVTVHSYPEDREFLSPGVEDAQIAYQKFLKWGPMQMQEDFARHLKKEFGKPIVVGRWCMVPLGGSVMSTLDFTPFVKSDALDFLVAQPVYHRRAPGVACGVRVPLASFRANGKMFLNEFDLRTWHGRSGATEARGVFLSEATDLPMWETVHRRLAGQMFANRMGWWYFDMSDNWFDEPDIQADIASVRKAASRLVAEKPDEWRPSVAVVVDEEGLLLRNRVGRKLSMREVENTAEQLQTLASASVPFDILLAEDMLSGKVRPGNYKALVMAGFYRIDAKRDRLFKSLKAGGAKLLFLADSGACGGAEACTGFDKVDEPGGLSSEMFNSFVNKAGGYVSAPIGLQVDMNGNFVSVHCLKTGTYDFVLPFTADVQNVKTGERFKAVKSMSLDLSGGETRWFSLHRRQN